MLMYMVKTSSWPADRLRALLDEVGKATELSGAALAALIPIDQSQFSRWKTGSSRPKYESLVALGEGLRARFPSLRVGPTELLEAAGYSIEEPAPADGSAPPRFQPVSEDLWKQGRGIDLMELRGEVERALAALPENRRERLERVMADENEALERIERERLERWAEVVRAADPNSD